MRIINTSRYPSKEVRSILHFLGTPSGKSHLLEVHVKNCYVYPYAGHFYVDADTGCHPYVKSSKPYLIIIRVGSPESFPFYVGYCKYRSFLVKDWKEAILYVYAHEVGHMRQWLNPRRLRKRRIFNESKADQYALKALERWRQHM